MENTIKEKPTKIKKAVSYAKWGYIFIIPFFVAYLAFTLYPQITTFIYSFLDYKYEGTKLIGPTFYGFQNYVDLFSVDLNGEILILKCLWNTVIMWLLGAVVQLAFSLILALFFTSTRLNLKCTGFFKAVYYMPNLIMATAFALLFYGIFTQGGPFSNIMQSLGLADRDIDYVTTYTWTTRSIVALMNFLMWFGNTTILLMAGIMGIDESLFESARMDGASSTRVFFDITLPLLKPILIYVVITSMIGGLQMFDVPQVLTKGEGKPARTTKTLVMLLNDNLSGPRNYGVASSIAIILFITTAVFSFIVFKSISKKDE